MSGERVDGIHPHVLKVELDLFSGGFEPYVRGQQSGFWVELLGGPQGHPSSAVMVWWLPEDWHERVGAGGRYRFEERGEASRLHLAYGNHLREVAEIEAKMTFQKPLEEY